MKRIAMLLAVLAALITLPAAAQRNSSGVSNGQSRADWWRVDTYTERRQVLLVDGAPYERPDGATPFIAYLMYATPKEDGEIGIIVGIHVYCAAKTWDLGSFWTIYADGRTESTMGAYSQPEPLTPGSEIYRFACVADRSGFAHFPGRVLSDVVAETFATPPRN